MSQSNYYDRIASMYDQTRWMTDGVAEEIADFIVELVGATADTSFLEPLPPARKTFQDQFYEVLSSYISRDRGAYMPYPADKLIGAIAIQDYLHSKGYHSDYRVVKEWTVSNTVQEMLGFYRSRAYGFCWRVADTVFDRIIDDFEVFCREFYGSLDTELSSTATFELWTYTALV